MLTNPLITLTKIMPYIDFPAQSTIFVGFISFNLRGLNAFDQPKACFFRAAMNTVITTTKN